MSQAFIYHDSLKKNFGGQAKALKNMLRALFSIAGCMWILTYVFPFHSIEESTLFHVHQYQLYLLLLTVWGYQAKREYQRLRVVAEIAVEKGIRLEDVDEAILSARNQLSLFNILLRHYKSGSWFTLVFSWTLILLSVGLITLQLFLLFT